jgi:hypothetical protein
MFSLEKSSSGGGHEHPLRLDARAAVFYGA